jgi:glutathione S-transferase
MPATRPKHIKLTYFDFHGGRGEPIRLALAIAGIPFEDERIAFANWAECKPRERFGGLPQLEVDGETISQSNAIGRYAGILAGLYPEDPWRAAQCDEICDAVEAVSAQMTPSFQMKDPEERRRERERLAAGPIPGHLKWLATILEARGGQWFVENRLTMADLKVAETVRFLGSGRLDHIPKDIVHTAAPALVAHRERVLEHPGVKAYYARGAGA